MIYALLITYYMVELHGPGGQVFHVNPDEVVSLRSELAKREGHYSLDIHCLVNTADGKFLGEIEKCSEVRKLIEEERKQQ